MRPLVRCSIVREGAFCWFWRVWVEYEGREFTATGGMRRTRRDATMCGEAARRTLTATVRQMTGTPTTVRYRSTAGQRAGNGSTPRN